ncbi:MAG: DUF1003 domain-containing protein [Actinobacteria bacterium]|jgi:uncharacterized membrane protein|nr:DUF1003 domain-containing protein [Actinomycetota bacterium]NCU89273.1 DUF1003 domain-containing protein [Actinomycetota bacterium]NDE53304.1 DUF1003 domain-containing protein [Actinomycetota bacterium]
MAKNSRLETPRESRRAIRRSYDPETFGRLSERFARFIGTAKFLVYMTIFVTAWILWNVFGPQEFRFDQYPFIFLTLLLSLQASYAAPLILLAQNRQADRDRVTSQEDRARDERNLAVTEFMVREIAAMRKELVHEIKEILDERLGTDSKPDAK